MSTHVMLDLETLGVNPGDALLWIGAVKFTGDRIIGKFDMPLTIESSLRRGLKVDGGTLTWWFDPERDEARKQWFAADKVDLVEGLLNFNDWVKEVTDFPVDGFCWGNGVLMDNNLLIAAYRAAGVEWPFSYKQDACYRTFKNLLPKVKLERVGTYHNPVDDAESQARHLMEIVKTLGVRL